MELINQQEIGWEVWKLLGWRRHRGRTYYCKEGTGKGRNIDKGEKCKHHFSSEEENLAWNKDN